MGGNNAECPKIGRKSRTIVKNSHLDRTVAIEISLTTWKTPLCEAEKDLLSGFRRHFAPENSRSALSNKVKNAL